MMNAKRTGWWLIGLAGAAGFIAFLVFVSRPTDPQELAQQMQPQITRIRALQFKRDVVVQEQPLEAFRKHAEVSLRQMSVPEHEQVLRTLGLLASDETLDLEAARQQLQPSAPDGYYDPYSGRLFVVRTQSRRAEDAMRFVYARELCRALLDQHFDLKAYLEPRQDERLLNSDEMLARRMVVAGEVSYAGLLWGVKQEMGHIPERLPLQKVVDPTLSVERTLEMMQDPRMRAGERRAPEPREPDSVPAFISELTELSWRKGLLFTHEIRKRGWTRAVPLYTSAPPASTEQILHPRKWFTRESPVQIEWPSFATSELFADWELLDQGVLGELLWRVIFRVHRLSSQLFTAPGGWNGDRYAVFKRRDSGDMLLLAYTAWDDEMHATSFADSYRVLVEQKYPDAPQPVRIVADGRRVVIVEGGEESTLDAFVEFVQSARQIQEAVAVER